MKKTLNKGFTLIELLVVIAVLGILAAVVLVAINPQARIQDARNSGVRSDIGQIGSALEAYFTENDGSYPDNTAGLDALVSDEQLKTVPVPASARAGAGCTVATAYGYLAVGTEAAAWADLEPCGEDAAWYVYFTKLGKTCEAQTAAPAGTGISDVTGCQ